LTFDFLEILFFQQLSIVPNPYFRFKQFTIYHDRCAMKVTTDSCFFGAWASEQIRNHQSEIRNALDIGTGTGLLSLMIAQKNTIEIDAVEIDEEASKQAGENIAASPWGERVKVHRSNILDLPPSQKFDAIICNPPFYENELNSDNRQKNIAHHSEELTIQEVIQIIAKHLEANGLFFLLYPYKRDEEIKKLLNQQQLFPTKSVILKQSVKHQPFRMITTGSPLKNGIEEMETISIRDENQNYTEPFVGLLKDYYLYL